MLQEPPGSGFLPRAVERCPPVCKHTQACADPAVQVLCNTHRHSNIWKRNSLCWSETIDSVNKNVLNCTVSCRSLKRWIHVKSSSLHNNPSAWSPLTFRHLYQDFHSLLSVQLFFICCQSQKHSTVVLAKYFMNQWLDLNETFRK